MDRKYNGYSWCKVKTTNINNDFNLTFCKTRRLGHLECWNHLHNYLVLNGNPNEPTWIGNTIHSVSKDYFAPSTPFCRLIWLKWQFILEPMVILLPKACVELSWNKSKPWSKKRFLTGHQQLVSYFPGYK